MSNDDPKAPNINLQTSSGGGLYFLVGALMVAVLVGGYFVLGAPGLHTNVARAPDRKIDVVIERPSAPVATPSPAAPAPATPAPAAPRQ